MYCMSGVALENIIMSACSIYLRLSVPQCDSSHHTIDFFSIFHICSFYTHKLCTLIVEYFRFYLHTIWRGLMLYILWFQYSLWCNICSKFDTTTLLPDPVGRHKYVHLYFSMDCNINFIACVWYSLKSTRMCWVWAFWISYYTLFETTPT